MATLLCRGFANAGCPQADGHNRWRLAIVNGVSWLIDPCGEQFFSIGINGIVEGPDAPTTEGAAAQPAPSVSDPASWGKQTSRQISAWGFNTAGGFSSDKLPMPIIPVLELGWRSHFLWADPYDPSVEEKMNVAAREAVSVYKRAGRRIGYFSDNEVGWYNSALFRFYIAKPPANFTKRKLVDVIRDYYGQDWRRFTDDFVVPAGIYDFRMLLESSDAQVFMRPDAKGMGLIRRWTIMITSRYYKLVHDALRRADPDALVFADRLPPFYDPDAVRAMAPYVDAVAANYDVDSPDGWIAHYYFDGLRRLTGNKPILVSEWYFSARENRSGNVNNGHLMTVQTQEERAQGAASAARHFARLPNIIGIHWFQYYDEPTGGRWRDREDYDFGLLDTSRRPYEQLVTALGEANRLLGEIHHNSALSAPSAGAAEIEVPEANIDARKADLVLWPKDRALVPGMKAAASDIVFGDFLLAWSAQGLHLATISMDYYDRYLLAYGDKFPLQDAFRIDVGLDAGAGAGAHKFVVFAFPAKKFARKEKFVMRTELFRSDRGKLADVPSAIATDLGSDEARIKLQITIPWQALGLAGPPREGKLRLQLGATSFYRTRSMSLSGETSQQAIDNLAGWKTVRLQRTNSQTGVGLYNQAENRNDTLHDRIIH
ncbi:MAG: hypothetical protein ABSD31_12900 [Candidatus Binataceae bacterium]